MMHHPTDSEPQDRPSAPDWLDVVIVGGCGHIGLPFGLVLAESGLTVGLLDTDADRRALVSAGRMPFAEEGAQELLTRHIGGRVHVVSDLSIIRTCDTIVITIGTPIDEYLNPKLLPILNLFRAMRPHMHAGHHVMLRSTVFPGTTHRLFETARKAGFDLDISFCPERVVQGQAIHETGAFPQIVSGTTPRAVRCADAMFNRMGVKTIQVEPMEAELAKLFTNAFRYISFGVINQFYMIAEQNGLSYERIHHAMTHGYERLKNLPRPGFAAGPCLLKDTMQLAAYSPSGFQLGHGAMHANEGLPNFLVNQLIHRHGVDPEGRVVGILGMTFKADSDDIRDSLSFKLAKLLRFHGAEVLCSDEYLTDGDYVSMQRLVERADVIFIGVPHQAYRSLVIPEDKILIDVWNSVRRVVAA